MSLKKTPFFELRSGTLDLLHFVVKTGDLLALRDELQRRFEATPEFFSNEAVVIDLRRYEANQRVDLHALGQLLSNFKMRPAGVVGTDEQRGWVESAGFALIESRLRHDAEPVAPAEPEPEPEAVAEAAPATRSTLIVDRPLRSGQRIYAEGDVVVLGLVSYGAEVIAEGNIHIYAPLRGRALAGVHGNLDARIFCTCLEPELISIAGIYRTTETPLTPDVLGQAVQIRLDAEKLLIEPLRLN
ncbi:septum site-determining protein MinC [Chitinasiproducens palmae]|uniref:Probable septum site-determining protein MinC n=1 Tax=Chitinasiproducens palmae TaxID=1770053 RepID=A0A1H2PVC3_9BURK|nr:septum site-determining protein MinC [Chitinasiproducens palmae]SDV51208.1 septum site-determining protein MinC [Chitinasiproducens palmae]